MPYHKYEPQSIVENSNYKLYRDRSILTDRNIQSNRPDIIILDSTIKEAHLIEISIPNCNNVHSTITEWLHKYNDLQDEFISIRQMKTACIITLVLSTTGNISNKLHEVLKLFNLRPALYILVQKAIILAGRWISSRSVTIILQGCWQVLSPTRKETSYNDRRFWCSYILFIIIIGGILVLFVCTHTTRLASNEIFSPSNKTHREVGWAKDLSAPRYMRISWTYVK